LAAGVLGWMSCKWSLPLWLEQTNPDVGCLLWSYIRRQNSSSNESRNGWGKRYTIIMSFLEMLFLNIISWSRGNLVEGVGPVICKSG
jgi:hypothetical protein